MINCEVLEKSLKRLLNLSTLASSKGASISSRRHKGDGFTLKIANKRAIVDKAFSPPESKEIF